MCSMEPRYQKEFFPTGNVAGLRIKQNLNIFKHLQSPAVFSSFLSTFKYLSFICYLDIIIPGTRYS